MIISVHIPKTAGTSFFLALHKAYGERLVEDKTYDPDSNLPWLAEFLAAYQYDSAYCWRHDTNHALRKLQRRVYFFAKRRTLGKLLGEFASRFDVIHGHFPAEKYKALFPNASLVTFLRDPLDHAISHYSYLCRSPTHFVPRTKIIAKNRRPGQEASYRIHEHGYNFTQFCSLPYARMFFDYYLGGIAIDQFAYVGIADEYEKSLSLYNRIFGTNMEAIEANRNPNPVKLTDLCSKKDTESVLDLLAKQQAYYQQGRRHFADLCAKHFFVPR